MKGNSPGVQFNDRKLAADVRTMTLNECMKHLKNPKSKYYGPVLLSLSRTVLPRLAEVTGDSGTPLVIQISESVAKKNGINTGTDSSR